MSAAKLVHNAVCFGSHGGSRSLVGYVADRYEARAVMKAYLISDVTVRDRRLSRCTALAPPVQLKRSADATWYEVGRSAR